MKRTSNVEPRILGVAAFACYAFAVACCGAAAYALLTLSVAAHGDLLRQGLGAPGSMF